MPNTKSSIKHVRQTERRTARNRSLKTRVKVMEKKFLAAVAKGDKELAKASLSAAIKAYGKAAKKGVLKSGKVSRKQSRLQLKLNALARPAEAKPSETK